MVTWILIIFYAQQIEAIKGNLESQTNNFNNEVEKFGMRWFQFRPNEEQLEGDADHIQSAISFVAEKRLEWDQLMETRDSLRWEYDISRVASGVTLDIFWCT